MARSNCKKMSARSTEREIMDSATSFLAAHGSTPPSRELRGVDWCGSPHTLVNSRKLSHSSGRTNNPQ